MQGLVIYASTPSTWETEAGGAFKDILGYIRRLWLMQNKDFGYSKDSIIFIHF